MESPFCIEAAATEAGDAPFLMHEGGVLSFEEASERSRRLQEVLRQKLRDSEQPLALRATNRPETLLVIAALIKARIPFVPIHPKLTPTESARLVSASHAQCSLDDTAIDELFDVAESLSPLNDVALPDKTPSLDSPLAIVFTSGTSALPRGAILTHRSFLASANASASNLGWRASDRWLACLPLGHVGGLSIVTRCLLARRPIVLLPSFDPKHVLETIERKKATILSVVPTMLQDLLEADTHGILARLRAILVGGAAASPSLLRECHARSIPALASYGLTEMCSQVTAQRLDEPRASKGVGRPLPGVEVDVRDGGIFVRGNARMRGYLGERPLEPSGWFETGDLGEFDEQGTLYVHARRSDLIVSGGENIAPREVEVALEECHGIRRAVVVGVPDPRWGQAVAAMVEPQSGVEPDLTRLREDLAAKLAPFKRPKLIAVTRSWPRLGETKIDRRRVAEDLKRRKSERPLQGEPEA
jgi:O-succinylbenzoic acid--CoA ligase